MSALPKLQLEIAAIEAQERELEEQAEIRAGYVWREQLWQAIEAYIATNGGYDRAAQDLERRWGAKGRPVSSSILNAALKDSNRNNFRAEWLDYFAARSEEVANLLARRVKPSKTTEQALDDVIAEVRDTLSHKQSEALLRRARAR